MVYPSHEGSGSGGHSGPVVCERVRIPAVRVVRRVAEVAGDERSEEVRAGDRDRPLVDQVVVDA